MIIKQCIVSIALLFFFGGCTGTNPGPGNNENLSPDHKRIFLTDNDYSGSEAAYADEACRMSASTFGSTGTWVAWLSYVSTGLPEPSNAIDLVKDVGPWYDLDGHLIFPNKDALLQGPVYPVRKTNWGRDLPSGVPIWTGTGGGGIATKNVCLNTFVGKVWYSESKNDLGDIAHVGQTGPLWMYDGSQSCNLRAHILCIEQ